MGKDTKGSAIIPTLLTGAAVYFGLNNDSNKLGDITKQALSRMIDDQAQTPAQPRHENRRNRGNRRFNRQHKKNHKQ
jgi:hypothetical protein